MIIAFIIFVSILLIVISILCLRFTILTTMEEDYKEIGVMKAIGIPQRNIKKIYLLKYVFITGIGATVGCLLSMVFTDIFSKNIILYMGAGEKSSNAFVISILTALIVGIIIVGFCILILRKFDKISAVQALRFGSSNTTKEKRINLFKLHKRRKISTNIFIGIKNILVRLKTYILLILLIIICTFIINVPINIVTTMTSDNFITYFGASESDLRIDLQGSSNIENEFEDIISYLKEDNDIEKYSVFTTSRYKVLDKEGSYNSITVETGDFSLFPIDYIEGREPKNNNEIALSYLNAKEINLSINDKITVLTDDNKEIQCVVTGIYQDITNGGKTAKANFETESKYPLRYMINMDFKSDKNIDSKKLEYKTHFSSVKVNNSSEFMNNTMGNTIDKLKLTVCISILISLFILILITSLFLKMLISKDLSQITIMRSLGFSKKDIQKQYFVSWGLISLIGVILGTVLSNTAGETLIGLAMSTMGAAQIKFIINPIIAYLIVPVALIGIGITTTFLNTRHIENTSISKMNGE